MSSVNKSWALLALFSTMLLLVGHHFAGREGVLWALILSLGINCFIYFFAPQRALLLFKTNEVEGQDPWGIQLALNEIALKIRTPKPKILIVQSHTPQAAATARNGNNPHFILTAGLLELLNKNELKAVLAYLTAIVKRQETVGFTIAQVLADLILKITGIVDAIFRWIIVEKNRPQSALSNISTRLVAPLVGFLIRLTTNEQSYNETDQLAASIIEDPHHLASALWKLESYSQTKPIQVPPSYSHMFIVNPLTKKSWTRYFHAQPSTKDRIKKIIGYYPI